MKTENGEVFLVHQDNTKEMVRIATLEDGTKVALKNDGTYQLLSDDIILDESYTSGDESKDKINEEIDNAGFDSSGYGIHGRQVTYVNRDKLHKLMEGSPKGQKKRIWIKTCINKEGRVTYVELDEGNTDVKNTNVLKSAMSLVAGYKFEASENAPREECGLVKIVIDRN